MFDGLTQKCDLCRATIEMGEQYGVLVFNIERMTSAASITVDKSENVNIMCMKCADKYKGENAKHLLD